MPVHVWYLHMEDHPQEKCIENCWVGNFKGWWVMCFCRMFRWNSIIHSPIKWMKGKNGKIWLMCIMVPGNFHGKQNVSIIFQTSLIKQESSCFSVIGKHTYIRVKNLLFDQLKEIFRNTPLINDLASARVQTPRNLLMMSVWQCKQLCWAQCHNNNVCGMATQPIINTACANKQIHWYAMKHYNTIDLCIWYWKLYWTIYTSTFTYSYLPCFYLIYQQSKNFQSILLFL